jgi:tetratricopeptide (TPR) repeat protein
MVRARLLVAGVAVVAIAVTGCETTPKTTSGMPVQTNLPGQGSMLSRAFGPKFGPTEPTPPPIVDAPKRGPIKAETDVAFADVNVEAAFAEDRAPQERDGLLDEARQRYQRAIQKDPKSYLAYRGLARLYTRTGDRERAIPAYQNWLHAAPQDHAAAHEMALACARFDDWANAATACEYALNIDPENRRYKRTYGLCLARTGQHDKAFETMLKVMNEAEARTAMARVLFDMGQPDAGREQLALALKADPNFEAARQLQADPTGGIQQASFNTPAGN